MPRIIAGTLKGRHLPGPRGSGTRPTSDKVREAIFSRLDGWGAIEGASVLDLYAGTGALALEAISRGAERAELLDISSGIVAQLRRAVRELGLGPCVAVGRGSARARARQLGEAGAGEITLLFLDPPYDVPTDELELLLTVIRPALADDAVVVIERSTRTRSVTWPHGYLDDGTKHYGETVIQYGGPGTAEAAAEEVTIANTAAAPTAH